MKGLNWSKRELVLGGCAAVFLLLMVVSYIHPFSKKSDSEALKWQELPQKMNETDMDEVKKAEKQQENPKTIVIDVKGAVKAPGVYKMKEGDRVIDVVEKAGGFLEKADRKKINLAKLVKDEMVVYVPREGEKKGRMLPAITGGGENKGKVAINSADASELDKLPGVGPATAEAIITYRKEQGPFEKIEDLLNVSGIGDATLQKMKDKIVLR
ncbi:MAG TPA: helix-hairpin-helix domain-containing protein [Bacillales bacterium]